MQPVAVAGGQRLRDLGQHVLGDRFGQFRQIVGVQLSQRPHQFRPVQRLNQGIPDRIGDLQ